MRKITGYTIGFILSLIGAVIVYKLWLFPLSVPIYYNLDALLSLKSVKSLISEHWYLNSHRLGAPFGANFYDFTSADLLLHLLLKFLGWLFKDAFTTLNIFYILNFPLITITSIATFRHYKISWFNSIFGGLIFAFLPYRLFRNECHLGLTSYFIIPLTILSTLLVFGKYSTIVKDKKKIIFLLASSVLTGISGIYYAYFAMFLFAGAGLVSYLEHKKLKQLIFPFLSIFLIFIAVFISLLPSVIFQIKHGPNIEVAKRAPVESEIYGLRVAQLFIPSSGYKYNPLNNLINYYYGQTFENRGERSEYLGAVGILGFLVLLIELLKRKAVGAKERLKQSLAFLNIAAVLLATASSFGTLVAYIIFPSIRAYNRISVYIAFFSIFAALLFFDKILIKACRKTKPFIYLFFFFFFLASLFDQVYPLRLRRADINSIKEEFNSNRNFVQKIENSVPKNSMIFQLPYKAFPESQPINKLKDYDLLFGYVHSETLSWSYGAMKGREGDMWLQKITELPVNDMLEAVSAAGFNGLYIDRYGFEDEGIKIESQLRDIIRQEPLQSNNGRLSFFNLLEYNSYLKNKYSEKQLSEKYQNFLYPIYYEWISGCGELEQADQSSYRWCTKRAKLRLVNPGNTSKKANFEFYLSGGDEKPVEFNIAGKLLNAKEHINNKVKKYNYELDVPPGSYSLNMDIDAKRVVSPGDPRELYFRIADLKLTQVNTILEE